MESIKFKPELLSPAGTLKNMRYAFAYGADAVYAGQPRYSLRVRNNEFNHENLAIGINEAHAKGKKFYVVVNIAPHNSKLKTFVKDLKPVVDMKPDALIMSDPGLIMLVREHFPEVEIHLSVQSNAVNWATIKFWHKLGLTRVVLSRELSIDEIAEIKKTVPEMELEVFIHGALCVAYSGRCLLSGYINKRDPNQGTCTNACRWKYNVAEGKQDEIGQIVHLHSPEKVKEEIPVEKPTDKVYLLEESVRPGEYMQAYEDEHGTYIMNSKDLRAVELVEDLTKIGVHSLKIEGRTKSHYYCAKTAQVYRNAIDAAAEGKPFDPNLLTELDSLANRGYTSGFLKRHQFEDLQNYEHSHSKLTRQQFVGEFTGNKQGELAEVIVKNKFSVGDNVELMTPAGNIHYDLTHMKDKKGNDMKAGLGDGYIVYIPVPQGYNLDYALLMRNFD